MTDYEPQIIKQNRGPRIEFDGRMIGEMSTRSDGDLHWIENTLWETPSGKWVLEIRKCSDKEGQQDFAEAHVFDQADDMERKIAVVDALNWEFKAQQWVKKKLGWKLIRRVE